MPVVIACPNCQRQYSMPQDPAGKQVKCPNCQTVFAARAAATAAAAAPAASPEQRQKAMQQQKAQQAAMSKMGIGGPLQASPKLFPEQTPSKVDPLANHVIEDPGFADVDIEEIRRNQADKESNMFKNPFQTGEVKSDLSSGGQPTRDANWLFMSFDGRIPRRTFWLATLILAVINIGFSLGIYFLLGPENIGGMIASFILSILIGYFSLAVQAKRWHDRGWSGWMVLINFTVILGIWALIECGFLRGTVGRNKYGPDPT